MPCIIKALYAKFLVYRNKNIANQTHGFTKIVSKKVLKVIQKASDVPKAVCSKKYLFPHSLLKARHSASTFLCFVNIALLLKIEKYMLNGYY